ncbi:MAG: DUF3050 domain-containing protein, partial [Pirellulales bacterium]|nr:DUF3050 domain-containing protein [Pirellulales bacterium]
MSGSASLASQPTFLKTATTGPSEKAVTQQDMTDYRIELGDSRERLVQHPIYNLVNSPERMRTFMESHIWAVWDFRGVLVAVVAGRGPVGGPARARDLELALPVWGRHVVAAVRKPDDRQVVAGPGYLLVDQVAPVGARQNRH